MVVAITGASGSIYAKLLLHRLGALNNQIEELALVMSDNANTVWKEELQEEFQLPEGVKLYSKMDFYAPFASGSAQYNTMIICPCSMGTLARISTGISNDLITRAADVILKERRKLILVTRDTPLSLIHINNMKTVTEAGAIICPASPSFYNNPKSIDEVAMTVVNRIIDLAGLENPSYRWGSH
ncbi:MAG: UbiX family flavin prenyltransferase [Sphingobacteriaceae bacterium]|nr:UbiX family flavin prenyltransferase [Sphingobacteriaceae bacterium]